MKQWKIGCIVLLSICVCGLTAMLIYAGVLHSRGDSFRFGAGGRQEFNGEATGEIAAADAERIMLDFSPSASDVVLHRGETPQLVIREKYNAWNGEYKQAELTEEDGVITVTGNRNRRESGWGFFFLNSGSYVSTEVYLPASFHGTLQIRNRSGNISNAEALELEKFSCDMTSGDLKLRDSDIGEIELDLTSGNVFCEMESLAGSISATSGDIRLSADRLGGDTDIETTSGNTKIELGADAAFLFDGKVTSGSIDTDWEDDIIYRDWEDNAVEGKVGTNPVYKLSVRMTSGDVRLEKR